MSWYPLRRRSPHSVQPQCQLVAKGWDTQPEAAPALEAVHALRQDSIPTGTRQLWAAQCSPGCTAVER